MLGMSDAQKKPTPKKQTRQWPYRWCAAFLEALALTGIVSKAAELAKIDRTWVYDLRREDPTFAAAWAEALRNATDLLIEEARRRAYEGVDEPVIYKGQPTE